MAPRETENNDKQRALWYVMVFSGAVNCLLSKRRKWFLFIHIAPGNIVDFWNSDFLKETQTFWKSHNWTFLLHEFFSLPSSLHEFFFLAFSLAWIIYLLESCPRNGNQRSFSAGEKNARTVPAVTGFSTVWNELMAPRELLVLDSGWNWGETTGRPEPLTGTVVDKTELNLWLVVTKTKTPTFYLSYYSFIILFIIYLHIIHYLFYLYVVSPVSVS